MRSKTILCISTSLIGLGLATPVAAQEASSDIIVTARRVEERLQDVPISITVFNQQQLSNRNVTNSEDLARYTPSLSSNSNFGADNSSFSLRGFVQDSGTAPSVGVYFADVVAPRGASNNIVVGDGAGPGYFFDLANVQVLKGPQGTLQGRNTTGGAVLLVPQKPTGDFGGYIEGSIGNYSMKRIQGAINIPVMDTLRVRLAVDHQTRDGYLINTSGVGARDFNDIDYTAVRFSAVADLTPNLENYTIISYTKSHNNGTFQKLVAADGTDGLLGPLAAAQIANQKGDFWHGAQDYTDSYSKLETWQIINTTTWKATDNLTVKNIASYAQLTSDLRDAQFGTNFRSTGAPVFYRIGDIVDFAGSSPLPGGHTAHESTFTEELQFQGHMDKLDWQGGGYLEIASPLGLSGSQTPNFTNCVNPTVSLLCSGTTPFTGGTNYTATQTSFHDVGVYAQATYKFTDKLKFTGGIRYTWDHEVSNNRILFYSGYASTLSLPTQYQCVNPASVGYTATPSAIGTLGANTCNTSFYQHSDAATWLADIDYTPVQDLLLYAKYSRGYRAAVIAPVVTGSYNYVAPEKVDTYEVGAKTSFDSFLRGTFNVAAFYNDFTNQQTQLGFNSTVVSPSAAPVNLGKSRIWGIEVDASVTPFTGFNISGGYAHLDSKIRSIPDYVSNPPTGAIYTLTGIPSVGDPLALAPKNKFTITADYTLPLDEKIGAITFGATFTHTDSMLSNYQDKLYQSATASQAVLDLIHSLSYLKPTDLLNLNVTWKGVAGSPVDISAFATNVTNEKYYTYTPGLVGQTGFEDANVGEPRMYGARLRFHFGA